MDYIKTEKENLLRDPISKAIIVNDDKARNEWKRKQAKQKQIEENILQLETSIEELHSCAKEINTIKKDIEDIKTLLMSLKIERDKI